MQKHGLTPDQKLRKSIYDALPERNAGKSDSERSVTILGSDFALDETSDIKRLLKAENIEVRELPTCDSWKAYENLADSRIFIACYPPGKYDWKVRQRGLGRKRYIFREALIMKKSSDNGECWSRRLRKV